MVYDVAKALPKAANTVTDVRVTIPAYRNIPNIDSGSCSSNRARSLALIRLTAKKLSVEGVQVFGIECKQILIVQKCTLKIIRFMLIMASAFRSSVQRCLDISSSLVSNQILFTRIIGIQVVFSLLKSRYQQHDFENTRSYQSTTRCSKAYSTYDASRNVFLKCTVVMFRSCGREDTHVTMLKAVSCALIKSTQ